MFNITSEVYLPVVIERETCGSHNAQKGYPCWTLETSGGSLLLGICNKRAKRAGFNHPVSQKSMRTFQSKKK